MAISISFRYTFMVISISSSYSMLDWIHKLSEKWSNCNYSKSDQNWNGSLTRMIFRWIYISMYACSIFLLAPLTNIPFVKHKNEKCFRNVNIRKREIGLNSFDFVVCWKWLIQSKSRLLYDVQLLDSPVLSFWSIHFCHIHSTESIGFVQ